MTTIDTWSTTTRSWEVLSPLADPIVGIVRRQYRKLRDVDDIWGHSIGAHGTDSGVVFGVPSNAYNGGGSPDPVSAELAAIGETVERYSASYPPVDSDKVIKGTSASLRADNKDVIDADDWQLFASCQYSNANFPYSRWDDDVSLWWRKGTDAVSGEGVWTPAQLIHMTGPWRGEEAIGYATSNGLACGITPVEAALSGLFEVVERDAFMLTWYNRISLPLLRIESSDRLHSYIKRYVSPTYLDPYLVDMTVYTGIPTILAVIRSRHSSLAPFALGAASAANIERAAEKAVTEAMYTRTWMKTEQREGRAILDTNYFESVKSFEDHIRLYAGTPLIAEADFLTSSTESTDVDNHQRFPEDGPQRLWNALVDRLTELGHRVLTFDVTSPDIREAGAAVVRTVIPGMRPIDVAYNARFLGGSRLLELPYELGLVHHPLTIDELNPAPHPFP
ncbi:YcaO-like family protein [Auritidibacter ignavus]|uniref:YcaO-like family protein n=1 Tax=Auritidibacter ignavus TaxID=678932 RepID=A0AAJ6AG10_9MICC|nr:YcaO-like family protein [Auritidibacter ignavus]WGH92661.1 YcaO-like family protein [Auritidibacter ignavus]